MEQKDSLWSIFVTNHQLISFLFLYIRKTKFYTPSFSDVLGLMHFICSVIFSFFPYRFCKFNKEHSRARNGNQEKKNPHVLMHRLRRPHPSGDGSKAMYKKAIKAALTTQHTLFNNCRLWLNTELCNSINNFLSYCVLVDARISASEKDVVIFGAGRWLDFKKRVPFLVGIPPNLLGIFKTSTRFYEFLTLM